MKKILIAAIFLNCISIYSMDSMTISIDDISIESPIGWFAQYTKSPQLFFLFSPLENNDTFQENCNLTIEYLSVPYTIDEYMADSVTALESVYKGFQLASSRDNYHVFTGYIGETLVKQMQFFYIAEAKAYVLTFSSDPDNFDRYRDQFRSIAETFRYRR